MHRREVPDLSEAFSLPSLGLGRLVRADRVAALTRRVDARNSTALTRGSTAKGTVVGAARQVSDGAAPRVSGQPRRGPAPWDVLASLG